LLAAGRSADVYELSPHQVLRRYRDGRNPSGEVALMHHVADYGFPVLGVQHLGGPDLLLERLIGPPLSQALATGRVGTREGADILADLHRRLHAIPAPAGGVVVHLDLRPEHVILSDERGPVLIDWAHAGGGTAALDEAMTALLLAEAAVGADYAPEPRALLAAFVGAADDDSMPELDAAIELRRDELTLPATEHDALTLAARLVRTFADLTANG